MADFRSHKMKFFALGCALLAYYIHVLLAERGCSFSVNESRDEKRAPILLYNDTSLSTPNVTLKNCELVTVLCPDPRNYLVQSNLNKTYATCVQGKILRVGNDDYKFDDLQCRRIVKGTIAATSRRCGNDEGLLYKIGYQATSKLFIKLIEVCYDAELGITLYTEHLLHGQDIRQASKSNYRPGFSPEGASVSVSVAYKQVYQKATLNKLLKSAKVAERYVNKTSFLARGHMAPDADFLLAATQYTTYYYINTFPQWQVINVANWKRVEGMVRGVADRVKETLTIVTGTYDVLSLPDWRNRQVEIYLVTGKKLPVPKFTWKIVYSKKSNQAIVLICLNNPFVKEIRENDMFCTDICSSVGWNSTSWTNYERGFVYCCDYREFAAVVKTAPKLKVVGTLQGPK